MKYAVEMGTDAMVHIRSFIKIGSGIQRLIGEVEGFTDTDAQKHAHRQHEDCISLVLFYNKRNVG
jgi:hypothetical protein